MPIKVYHTTDNKEELQVQVFGLWPNSSLWLAKLNRKLLIVQKFT